MRAALGFLTVVGGAAPPDRRAAAWFGLVGGLVGLVVGAAWWGASEVWPPALAAVVAVAADAALTGMLHLDGVADAADGLLPPVDRSRRLAIMATPDVGAFGATALLVVVAARVAALAALTPDPLLIAGLWAAARAAMALTMARVPYARTTGAASGFARPGALPAGASVVVACIVVAAARGAVPGLTAATASMAAFAAVVALAVRRVGGFTGDVLGAAGVVAETAGLVVAAARW